MTWGGLLIIITFCFLGYFGGLGGSSSLLDEEEDSEVEDELDDEEEPVSSSESFLPFSSSPNKTWLKVV